MCYSRELLSTGSSGLSTEDYFSLEEGYPYDPSLLGAAHYWNQNRGWLIAVSLQKSIVAIVLKFVFKLYSDFIEHPERENDSGKDRNCVKG